MQTYSDWQAHARTIDTKSGADGWKTTEISRRYDYKVIRRRYDELVEVNRAGDPERLLYYLDEGIHGNMGGMGAPNLYTRAAFGTKNLIADYTEELVSALRQVEAIPADVIPDHEKRAFFRRASLGFGKTALMLSGAGSLGPFHMGVVKELVNQDILPRIISGASAGSLVAAVIGTRTATDLKTLLNSNEIQRTLSIGSDETRRQMDVHDLHMYVERLIPDLTFLEAFELSGVHINISVAPREVQQRSRLLNATTSPNAMIREAIYASCAIPGVFPAVTLAAKSRTGKRQNYISSRKWVDGSMTDDLPAKRLARLYGANHFISSQANPLVLWAIPDTHKESNLLGKLADIYQSATREWLKAIYPLTMQVVGKSHPLNLMTRMCFEVLTQDYTADINILPAQKIYRPGIMLATLSTAETAALIKEGEKSTWPQVERIRICTAVNRCLDDILLNLGDDGS
jgi:TAG lipase/steryl ester hydrolase/phospholipase A2/LPA acyltransferase